MNVILNLPFGLDIYEYKRKLIDNYIFIIVEDDFNDKILGLKSEGQLLIIS